MPSTKNDFQQGCSMGLHSGAAGPRARKEGGDLATVADGIWPRADVKCLLQYAFSLLISS